MKQPKQGNLNTAGILLPFARAVNILKRRSGVNLSLSESPDLSRIDRAHYLLREYRLGCRLNDNFLRSHYQ